LATAIFAAPHDPHARRRALAELLLERYGVLTREQVLAEGVQGGFSALYPSLTELETLGVCRRGYFVEGLGGAQFALPGAVERLRATRGESLRSGAPSGARPGEQRVRVLAAVDPAQPYGAVLPWPRRDAGRRPARVAGSYVALVDDRPAIYLERGGRSILTFVDGSQPSAGEASPVELGLRALADAVRAGRIGAVALERVDGAPAIGSALEPTLVDVGFRLGPRRLTLRA
jgi:ATP-dependent helicase Lhr and Lhr-like helicase